MHTYHCLVFLCILIQYTLSIWRYGNSAGSSDVFTTRIPISLDYIGPDFTGLEWDASPNCQVANKSLPSTTIHCKQAGKYPVSVKNTTSDLPLSDIPQYLTVVEDCGCYNWYMIKVFDEDHVYMVEHQGLHNHEPEEEDEEHEEGSHDDNIEHHLDYVRVWIVDPLVASSEEQNKTAVNPSKHSEVLSQQFYHLGQVPSIRFSLHAAHMAHTEVKTLGFNYTGGYWNFAVTTHLEHQAAYEIVGSHVALYECFVSNTPILLCGQKYNLTLSAGNEAYLKAAHPKPRYIQDPCMQTVGALLTSTSVLISQDNFDTVHKVPAPADLQDGSAVADWLVFTSTHLVVLINGTVYRTGVAEARMEKVQGLPSNISGIRGRDFCSEGIYEEFENQLFVAWTDTEFYICSSDSIEKITWPDDVIPGVSLENATIFDIAFNTYPGIVGVMLGFKNNTDKLAIPLYDIFKKTWSKSLVWMSYDKTKTGPFVFMFQNSGKTSLLFRDQHRLYYSYDNGAQYGWMSLISCNVSYLVSGDEYIQEVSVSPLGQILIHTSKNNMFYGKIKLNSLVKIETGELENTNLAVRFDPLDKMYILTIQNDTVTKRLFPLQNAVISGLHPEQTCPFRYFIHNIHSDLYKVDMGERVSFWAQLIFKNTWSGVIQMQIHNTSLLKLIDHSDVEYSQRTVSQNKSITFYHENNYYGVDDYEAAKALTSGVVSFELKPSNQHLVCKSPTQVVSYISVGCPKNRHIRLRRPDSPNSNTECDKFHNYTIPKQFYRNADGESPSNDKVVVYDWETLGCPIQVFVTDQFLPEFDLYDGENFVRSVNASFIIWEIHGRTDFTYNATMEEAGCKREAQTWSKMNNSHGSWGPGNYRSCFEEENSAKNLAQLYEILNSSRRNQINFPEAMNGIFVFRIKIIDPNFSYCDLETTFAVSVHGQISPPNMFPLLICVCIIIFLILIGLVATYITYRSSSLEEFEAHMAVIEELHDERMAALQKEHEVHKRELEEHMKDIHKDESITPIPHDEMMFC